MALDLTKHPCFNAGVRHKTARIHLPVAPKCNVQCNYCDRKFDCMNESRPGVTSAVLTPKQALAYLDRAVEKVPNIAVVGIAGPGDPFASPEETLETLRLVRKNYPEMLLCVASNGLNVAPYVDDLARLKVSHVTLTVNAVDPVIGANIYAWVRDGKTIYRGDSAACVLLQRQRRAIRLLQAQGITVKINTIVVPGINEEHVEEVAKEMAAHGADIMNCIPLYPVTGTPFAEFEELGAAAIKEIRATIAQHIPQMQHCTRCRADAVGLLGAPQSDELVDIMNACASGADDTRQEKPYVAVASMEGMLVNQHLGEAGQLWIYGHTPDGVRLVEKRETPEPGQGNVRWFEMAKSLRDCRALVVSGIGHSPKRVLEHEGVHIIEMGGLISDGLASLFPHRRRAPGNAQDVQVLRVRVPGQRHRMRLTSQSFARRIPMQKPAHHIFVCASFRVAGEAKGVCHRKDSTSLLQYLQGELSDRDMERRCGLNHRLSEPVRARTDHGGLSGEPLVRHRERGKDRQHSRRIAGRSGCRRATLLNQRMSDKETRTLGCCLRADRNPRRRSGDCDGGQSGDVHRHRV